MRQSRKVRNGIVCCEAAAFIVLASLVSGTHRRQPVVRVFVFAFSTRQTEWDTPGYNRVTDGIANFDLSLDNGDRTPVYPLSPVCFGSDTFRVYVGQLVLGVLGAVGMFFTPWKFSHHGATLALVRAFSGLNLRQIRYEMLMLRESIVTFFLVASLVLFVRLLFMRRPILRTPLVFLGLVRSMAALAKPLFLALPAIFGLS